MKTKGLVRWAVAALFAAPTPVLAGEAFSVASFLDEAEAVAASDEPVECDLARYKCRQPFFFAGAEMTVMNVNARSGGIITASFTDTTAPGVSTFATVDGNGVN